MRNALIFEDESVVRKADMPHKNRISACLSSHAYVNLLLLVLVSIPCAWEFSVVPCERPLNALQCVGVDVVCRELDREKCSYFGGTYLVKGGVCGICNICVRYVGEWQPCNGSLVDVARSGGEVVSACQPPLQCSALLDGVCVATQHCQFYALTPF